MQGTKTGCRDSGYRITGFTAFLRASASPREGTKAGCKIDRMQGFRIQDNGLYRFSPRLRVSA